MAVTKIIEVVGSSPESSDGAVKAALEEARQSLRNIKAVDVVSTGLRGDNLDEWRSGEGDLEIIPVYTHGSALYYAVFLTCSPKQFCKGILKQFTFV